MSQVNMDGLPPEMQQRIAQIIEGAKQKQQPAPVQSGQAIGAEHYQQQQAPVVKQPSLMDHTIALRQEVAALRQELHAIAQVTDAVGQAVGQLYQMFQAQTEVTNYGSTYETPETSLQLNDDYWSSISYTNKRRLS